MKLKTPLYACFALILAMIAAAAYGYGQLPDDARIAIHFGFTGQADGFADKLPGLTVLPAIALGLTLLLALIPRIAPSRKGLEASSLAYGMTMVGVMMVLAVSQFALVAHALDPGFDVVRAIALACAVLTLVLGNYLGKARHNYVFGMRTPWTLANETVWDKTHRFTGRLMVLGGLILGAASFATTDDRALLAALLACMIGPALAGVVYSGIIYPRGQDA